MATKKQITIREFKAWLNGIEEMHEGVWAPTPEQWKKIRTKINNLPDEEVVIKQNSVDVAVELPVEKTHKIVENNKPPMTGQTASVTGGANKPVAVPVGPSQFNRMQPPAVQPMTTNGKTPDIDTSKSSYSSPFV